MESLNESLELEFAPPGELRSHLENLQEPWIADEGPTDVGFRRGLPDGLLRPRGLAFDHQATIHWDEDSVRILKPAAPDPSVQALRHPVRVRQRFRRQAPNPLYRIDYLRRGTLLGSRYIPGDPNHAQA